MIIERPPRLFRALVPSGLFRVNTQGGGRDIYLTFDDGPIPEATPWVLEILDRYGIKATFFMVGDNARRYPELVEKVISAGHRTGNHTMHHLQGAKATTHKYLRDVTEAKYWTKCNLHGEMPLFRPPHGWLRPKQAKILARNYRIIMYDLVTRDYSFRLTAEDVVANVKRFARPGSIIVFHDSLKSLPRIKEALPKSIEWLLSQDYHFKLL